MDLDADLVSDCEELCAGGCEGVRELTRGVVRPSCKVSLSGTEGARSEPPQRNGFENLFD